MISPPPMQITITARAPQSRYQEAWHLHSKGQHAQACLALERMIDAGYVNADVTNLLGVQQVLLGRLHEAEDNFRTLLANHPQDLNVQYNLGWCLGRAQRWQEAIEAFDQVLAAEPTHINTLLNKAHVLYESGQRGAAFKTYELLLQLDPRNTQALFNLAKGFQDRLEFAQAQALYEEVIRIDPLHYGATANRAFMQHYIYPPRPQAALAFSLPLAQGLEAAMGAARSEPRDAVFDPDKRLRIGLVSADLRDHPVGYFIEGLLAQPLSRKADWVAFHNHRDFTSLSARIKPFFSAWHDVSQWSDGDLRQAIQNADVDVLIDLSGLTAGNRLAVFAACAAPVQLTWLGYFGSTGLSCMDGIIADPYCVPTSEEHFYTEPVLRMPGIRYCFNMHAEAPEVSALPAIAKGHITFGCFQEFAKLNDGVLAVWGRIAKAASQARWRIQARILDDPFERHQFRERLLRVGLDETRVDLHGAMTRRDYLQAHADVDLILDTFPFPGGTTTVEALWMGVPTLTLALPGMLGRQGEAINRSSGLSDWVTTSEDEYVARAVELAQPERFADLAQLRAQLRQQLVHKPLFDQPRFATDWHTLVRGAWRAKCAQHLSGASASLPQTSNQMAAQTETFAQQYASALAAYHAGDVRVALAQMRALSAESPLDAEACNLLGALEWATGNVAVAEQWFQRAVDMDPARADYRNNLAGVFSQSQRWQEALDQYEQVLTLEPRHVAALSNKAKTLSHLGLKELAVATYQQVLAVDGDNVGALQNLAIHHHQSWEWIQAQHFYKETLARTPTELPAISGLLFAQQFIPPVNAAAIADLSRKWGKQVEAASSAIRRSHWNNTPDPERRLRVGLLSADLREHPVGFFIEGLLGQAASQQVDWIAYHNQDEERPLTERIKPRFLAWHMCKGWSDGEIADAVEQDGVDVLIDLSGHTGGNRLGVIAARPAPVQLTWLGYFATTGISCLDGVIADPYSVPAMEEAWFSERVLRMPQLRYCMTSPAGAPAVSALPARTNGHITFGCFQELQKINEGVLSVWARIAQQVPDARWRIQSRGLSTPDQRAAFSTRLDSAGINPARVTLVGLMERERYLAAHAEVDLILDTFPYPGGTTTAEALWMGVPTLTLALPGMLGRQGEAINRSSGLDEWVAVNETEYVAKAVQWAQPERFDALSRLRSGLREHMAQQPLFDQPRFARDWHALVRSAWREACTRGWPRGPMP